MDYLDGRGGVRRGVSRTAVFVSISKLKIFSINSGEMRHGSTFFYRYFSDRVKSPARLETQKPGNAVPVRLSGFWNVRKHAGFQSKILCPIL